MTQVLFWSREKGGLVEVAPSNNKFKQLVGFARTLLELSLSQPRQGRPSHDSKTNCTWIRRFYFILVCWLTLGWTAPSQGAALNYEVRSAVDCQAFTGSWNCGSEVYFDIFVQKRGDGVCILKQTQSFSFEAIADGLSHPVPTSVATSETYQALFKDNDLFFTVTSPQQTSKFVVTWQSTHLVDLQMTESNQVTQLSCTK